MVDKLTVLIVFMVAVFAVSAVLLIMGTVPKIFETSNQINQTNILLEQRIALTEQQKHEDDARDKQAVMILAHVDAQLQLLKNNLTQLMTDMENRSISSSEQRFVMMKKLDANTGQNTKILANLDNKSKDHDRQSNEMRNLTDNVATSLKGYGDNSIEKFDKIIETQKKILGAINNTIS